MNTPKRARAGSHGQWSRESGAEIVEMAFVLPMLLALLIGVFWAGRAYNVYETITRAAREGARVAVAPSCATCGNTLPTSTTIQTQIDNVLASANMNTTGTGGVAVTIQQNQKLGLDPNNSNATWTVVSIAYPYQFSVPFTSVGTSSTTAPCTAAGICITTKAQMREENY